MPPRFRGNLIEKPVDRVVERVVEKPNVVEKVIEKPVDRVIEKIVEKPNVIEKIIDKPVDRVVERVVEKPNVVEKIIEKPVEHLVEKIIEKPVERIEAQGLVVDFPHRRVERLGSPIRLTPKEYDLLALLARNAGKVLTHRHLLRAVCEDFWMVGRGKVEPFDGDLADYRAYRLAQQAADAAPRASAAGGAEVDRKTQKRQEAEARQRLSEQKKPLLKRLTALERELTPLNAEKAALDAQLADEAIYSAERKSEMQAALKRQGEVSARLAELEEDWLMVQMEIEALEEANI